MIPVYSELSPKDGKIEKLFKLFVKEGKRLFNEKSFNELITLTNEWLKVYKKFLKICKREALISEKEFFKYRMIDVGALYEFYFIQIDSGLEVTNQLKEDYNWKPFIDNTIRNLIIINDLYSLKKEVNSGSGKSNYVYIKMKNQKLTAQRAVEQLIIEAHQAESLAFEHGQLLKVKHHIKGLYDYVDGVIATMGGNHFWSTVCKRYNSHNQHNQ